MSLDLDRTLSFAALIAATFVFVASAYAQPHAGDKPPAAASAAQAEHKGMHKMTAKERQQHRKEMHDKMHKDDNPCMGMMDKQRKGAAAANDKAADCGMKNKQQ